VEAYREYGKTSEVCKEDGKNEVIECSHKMNECWQGQETFQRA